MSDSESKLTDPKDRWDYVNDPERASRTWRELRERHRAAGKSMFIRHEAYPGQRLELCADGRWFIIDGESNRIEEVEPVEGIE